jgi:hypothetical protein
MLIKKFEEYHTIKVLDNFAMGQLVESDFYKYVT